MWFVGELIFFIKCNNSRAHDPPSLLGIEMWAGVDESIVFKQEEEG